MTLTFSTGVRPENEAMAAIEAGRGSHSELFDFTNRYRSTVTENWHSNTNFTIMSLPTVASSKPPHTTVNHTIQHFARGTKCLPSSSLSPWKVSST